MYLLYILFILLFRGIVDGASILGIPGSKADSSSVALDDIEGIPDIDKYLEQYGYMEKTSVKSESLRPGIVMNSDSSRENAIRKFQEFNGLKVTGVLDKDTLLKFRQPRCGVEDIPTKTEESEGRNPLPYTATGYKWPNNLVTWKTKTYTNKLPQNTQRYAFETAFKYWSDVTPLQFVQTSGDADIEIKFVSGDHGDGSYNAFDGIGGVLAHAFYPTTGDTHFDNDEKWVYHFNDGTDIETVAAHEFGHALGLSHSSVPDALMAPYYKGYDPNFKLHDDDIRGIQSLYGKQKRDFSSTTQTTESSVTTKSVRTTTPPTSSSLTTTTVVPTTSYVTKEPLCPMKFDAVCKGPDGSTYIFSKRLVYKLNGFTLDEDFPKLTKSVYQDAPINVGAAVYYSYKKQTFLFKGNRVWRYTNFTLDRGFPKTLSASSFPANIQAGISLQHSQGRQQIYLFGGRYFWEINPETLKMQPGFPLLISTYWRQIPDDIEAAVQLEDNFLYFFKGYSYRKYNFTEGRVLDNNPRRIETDFC